jgi:cytochrome c-type biogenesis protein CcmE
MGRIFITLVALFMAIAGIMVFQATRGTSSLVLTPSELVARAGQGDLLRIRVGGRVVEPIEYRTEPTMVLRFDAQDPKDEKGPAVSVVYENLKPDMFAAGRDVLIDGDYIGGVIKAAKLQTQCPSKYEPAIPGGHPGGVAGGSVAPHES